MTDHPLTDILNEVWGAPPACDHNWVTSEHFGMAENSCTNCGTMVTFGSQSIRPLKKSQDFK